MGDGSSLSDQAHITSIMLAWLELSDEGFDLRFLVDSVYAASFAQMSRRNGHPGVLQAATMLIVAVEAARRHGMSPTRVVVGSNHHENRFVGWLRDRGEDFTVEMARVATDDRMAAAIEAGSAALSDLDDLFSMLNELNQLDAGS